MKSSLVDSGPNEVVAYIARDFDNCSGVNQLAPKPSLRMVEDEKAFLKPPTVNFFVEKNRWNLFLDDVFNVN